MTVKAVTHNDGAVTGVETTEGRVGTDTVVCTIGWRTRELVAEHVSLPIYPFRWQSATLEPGWSIGNDYPMGWDAPMACYWRLEHNGDLHVGGGEYRVEKPGSVRSSVTEAFKRHIATSVPERL